MRSMAEIEAERRRARLPGEAASNTIHRSSLLVPHFPGFRSIISFLNHFLIKREIAHGACLITAIDGAGRRLGQKTITVDEPRVYWLDLGTVLPDPAANNFLVEFFSSQNLAIPFPAVMINHLGHDTFNM